MNEVDHINRLKRLKYRANHRGIKEMDIVLGGFANAMLDGLPEDMVEQFETLLIENDRDLLVWFTGEADFPIGELQTVFDLTNKPRTAPDGKGRVSLKKYHR